MKLFLVIFSLALSAALCAGELGAYNYEYNVGPLNRQETRYPNGTMTGDYSFIDEHGLTHQVQYTAGANQGFKVISHLVTGNGETLHVNSDYTPEVQAARDTHIAFQNYLRTVLPQVTEEEIPPLIITHVPSPVEKEPNVPIIYVNPPQRVIQQQIQQVQHVQHHSSDREAPEHTLLKARALLVENLPTRIKVNIAEIPVIFETPRHVVQQVEFGQRIVPLNHFEQTHFEHFVQPQVQTVQESIVPVSNHVQQTHFGDRITHEVVQPQVHTVQEVAQFVQQPRLEAQDVQLVNGFTPEVARATQEHLSHVAAIKAVLPNIEQ